jgi:hypothetical protein
MIAGDCGERAEPSQAEPSRAVPSRAEPSRAEPSRAEPSDDTPSRAEPSRFSGRWGRMPQLCGVAKYGSKIDVIGLVDWVGGLGMA